MTIRWYPLSQTTDNFLASAPFRYIVEVELPVSAERAWTALTADDTLASWSRLVTGVRWTSPRPFGIGTTRQVTLLRTITARERYYRWQDGSRKTFSVAEASIPGLRRIAEDYLIESTASGSRFTWTIAVETGRLLAPLLRLANPITIRVVRHVAAGCRSQVA